MIRSHKEHKDHKKETDSDLCAPLRETNIVALAPPYAIVVAASPRCELCS
jgi:hypothetical protein